LNGFTSASGCAQIAELKTAESARGDAAVARLGELQAALGNAKDSVKTQRKK
jgi:hypothetical protein